MAPKTKVFVLKQLIERLESVSECSGELYGVTCTASNSILLLAGVSQQDTYLPHDPALLLPLSLCGAYTTVGTAGAADTHLQGHCLVLRVIKGKKWVIQRRESADSTKWQDASIHVLSQEEMQEHLIVCRTSFFFDLTTHDKTADAKSILANIMVRLSSADSTCFQLYETDLILNSNLEQDGIAAANEVRHKEQTVRELMEEQEKDIKSNSYKNVSCLQFQMLQDCSAQTDKEAPVVKMSYEKSKIQKTCMKASCVTYVSKYVCVKELGGLLLKSVLQHLKLAEYWLVKSRTDKNIKGHLETVNVLPYKASHLVSLLYPKDTSEDELKSYRIKVSEALILPSNIPFFRRINAYEFHNDKECIHLYNTHIGLQEPSVNGLCSITQGIYSYHHYMQDKFNDNKWGCAYRSLQTIISWFRHQGYTDKLIPTHKEIQQCLVKIGDKPGKFVGSTEWIGSTEVGFVLESYLGVTSRFISVSSGEELADKGRELIHHFSTQGTPVMIGGGVLAHTILGVTWDSDTGDISYLILDPHYTGGEDIATIQRQGWCGWKGPKFWNAKAYYNLCLPQRPIIV